MRLIAAKYDSSACDIENYWEELKDEVILSLSQDFNCL